MTPVALHKRYIGRHRKGTAPTLVRTPDGGYWVLSYPATRVWSEREIEVLRTALLYHVRSQRTA